MTRPLVGVQLDSLVGLVPPKPRDVWSRQIDDLGIEITTVSFNWGNVEKDDGVWDWSRLDVWNDLREHASRPIVPLFLLFPIHMNERGPLPADLQDEPLDSPKLADRWDAFVAEAARRAGWDADHAVVTVGNEIDWFMGAHPDEAEAAIAFLDGAAAAVTRHAPNARPANTLQYGMLSWPNAQDIVDALNRNTAVASFTWYDINERIEVPDPPTPLEDALARMQEAARGKPVLLQEFSMATGALNRGSDELQAARVHEMFDALERRTQDELLALVWLTIEDWPRDAMRTYVDHQFDAALASSDVFFEFLVTLGIARADGTPKAAYRAWMDRAQRYRP
jgi:hypothetical protein